jgi:cytochrome c biogenesis factor
MLAGIVTSSAWGTSEQAQLPLGQPVEVQGQMMTFLGHVAGSEPQDRFSIRLEEPDQPETLTEVGMFRSGTGGEATVMHKPALLRGLTGDLYIAPLGLEQVNGGHEDLQLARDTPYPVGDATLTFEGFSTESMGDDGMVVLAHVRIQHGNDEELLDLPYRMVAGKATTETVVPKIASDLASLALQGMSVEQGMIRVHADTNQGEPLHVLSVEVSTKPLIGLLWSGTALLGLGCCVAFARRCAEERMVARVEREAAAREPARKGAKAAKGKKKQRRRGSATPPTLAHS